MCSDSPETVGCINRQWRTNWVARIDCEDTRKVQKSGGKMLYVASE